MTMQDKDLYQKLLGLTPPWCVVDVDLKMEQETVRVIIGHLPLLPFACPVCGAMSPIHDHRKRTWRHLDTCGFITIIEADVPRVSCHEHGVKQVSVPWAEPGSGFTAMFEAIVISWLKVAATKSVAERMKISWDETWGIKERAVARGMSRRTEAPITQLAVDETSFQKRHEYVTVLVDREKGVVVDILNDRKKKTLKSWLGKNKIQLKQLESVSMDMWEPFINAVLEEIPDAEKKICFDRFHVSGYFNKAVDKIRSQEHKAFAAGASPLTRTKYDWLRTKNNDGYKDKNAFLDLTRMNLKTARAWRIKEAATELWAYRYRAVAERNWKKLLGWISRSRLEPMKRVGSMVKSHLWGILNAIIHKATNAIAESFNATIQKIKARACGYRNRSRLRTAILFQLGGLSMLPSCVIHT